MPRIRTRFGQRTVVALGYLISPRIRQEKADATENAVLRVASRPYPKGSFQYGTAAVCAVIKSFRIVAAAVGCSADPVTVPLARPPGPYILYIAVLIANVLICREPARLLTACRPRPGRADPPGNTIRAFTGTTTTGPDAGKFTAAARCHAVHGSRGDGGGGPQHGESAGATGHDGPPLRVRCAVGTAVSRGEALARLSYRAGRSQIG